MVLSIPSINAVECVEISRDREHSKLREAQLHDEGSRMTPQVTKACWNCFGKCNCHCQFCYGQFLGHPDIDTESGKVLLEKIASAQIRTITFGGGDPLIRRDLEELVEYARGLNLQVEVQTNAQLLTDARFSALSKKVDLWGLSLDSFNDNVHDTIRARDGNYKKVVQAADLLITEEANWNLRTLVCLPTLDTFSDIGDWLTEIGFTGKWFLLQYSPVGDEMQNRGMFEISDAVFADATREVASRYSDRAFDIVSAPDKDRQGIYFLIAPDGATYNHPSPGEPYRIVGNILEDDVFDLIRRLDLDYHKHYARYGLPSGRSTNEEITKERLAPSTGIVGSIEPVRGSP